MWAKRKKLKRKKPNEKFSASMDMKNNEKEAPSVNRVDNETISGYLKKKEREKMMMNLWISSLKYIPSLDYSPSSFSLFTPYSKWRQRR